MAGEKPTVSFILSLIGGISILIVGLLFTFAMVSYGAFDTIYFLTFGVAFGSLVLIGSIMLYANPEQHVPWGIIVLVFSIASALSTGGFVIGLILGIIGGALGIAWKPSSKLPLQPPVAPITRICPSCGYVLSQVTKYCPHCGKELEP